MSQTVVPVSRLVQYLKRKLDSDNHIQRIFVQGEISNFTNHRSGHWYFTLKDATSRISCVMFQTYAKTCRRIPKEGEQVIVCANTSLFESSGQLQLYVVSIQVDGLGDLHQRYEILKNQLANEGLFAKEHKKNIPNYPNRICLICGANTAAREDVMSTIGRRWPLCEVIEYHTLVQGDQAAGQIITALKKCDDINADVILLVRGGGSIEDLWAFNDEKLARAIYQCNTPIVVGVGHEVDVTIADYVADLRAPTPTGAAELVTPSIEDEIENIEQFKQRMIAMLYQRLIVQRKQLQYLQQHHVFTSPQTLFQMQWMKLDYFSSKLENKAHQMITKRHEFEQLKERMINQIRSRNAVMSHSLSIKKQLLKQQMSAQLVQKRENFMKQVLMLDAYSPLKSLVRGYSLVYQSDELVIEAAQVDLNKEIKVVFQDGNLIAQPVKKEK